MRREGRRRDITGQDRGFRNLIIFSGGILVIAIIAFVITFAIYNNKVKNQSRVSMLNSGKIAELVPSVSSENERIEEASNPIGKTVNEMQNNIANTNLNSLVNSTANNVTNTNTNNTKNNVTNSTNNTNTVIEEARKEVKKELEFKFPVDGEITKAFAKENLVYSETLKEWVTHFGIDIKSEKTTIVKASEEGTVKWIKNDPRYGLTVIIEHEEGFKTVYANLLTTEFVQEGEKVSKGQTIGTVGTTATFEISDEPHLHFEILKDDVYVDPSIYLK